MFKPLAALAFAAVSVLAANAVVVAQSPEELVEQRQQLMKDDGRILKAAGALSGAEAAAAADELIANFTLLPTLFPEGSIVGDSKVLPAVWENKADFDALFEQATAHATEMKVAAEAGDAAAYGAAMKAIGGLCGQCHKAYRTR